MFVFEIINKDLVYALNFFIDITLIIYYNNKLRDRTCYTYNTKDRDVACDT